MEDQPVGGHAGGQGHVELATGRHVETHTFFVGQARHGDAEEGLRGVGHPVAPGRDRLPADGAQVGFVIDEERRAVDLGQLQQIAATDREPAIDAHHRRRGKEGGVDRSGGDGHGHISSGADTPRRPSPMFSPMRDASTSHSRAWARAGSTSSARIGQS